jgi:hypothetical protein
MTRKNFIGIPERWENSINNKFSVLYASNEQSERAAKHKFMSIIDMKDDGGEAQSY